MYISNNVCKHLFLPNGLCTNFVSLFLIVRKYSAFDSILEGHVSQIFVFDLISKFLHSTIILNNKNKPAHSCNFPTGPAFECGRRMSIRIRWQPCKNFHRLMKAAKCQPVAAKIYVRQHSIVECQKISSRYFMSFSMVSSVKFILANLGVERET